MTPVRLRPGIRERDPAQRGREKPGERVEKLLARRRVEALVRVGQPRGLPLDGFAHQWMRVAKKVDAVVRHQVEIAPVVFVPEIAALTANQADASIGVQRNRLESCLQLHAVTHVPAPSNARVSGCSPRPSSRPTA